MEGRQSLKSLTTLLEETTLHIQGPRATALLESTDTLQHFLDTEIDSPPMAYIHISGTHQEGVTQKIVTDFDVWAGGFKVDISGPISLSTTNTQPPMEVDRNDATYRRNALATFTTSLLEVPMPRRKLAIEKRIKPYDKEAVQTKIQRIASNVRYGGHVAVEFHIAHQVVEVHATSQTMVTPTSGSVALDGPDIEGPATYPRIVTLWEVRWPFSPDIPTLVERESPCPRRLPHFAEININPPARDWESRLMEAIVDGTLGEIRFDDPRPNKGPPMLRAMRERETALEVSPNNGYQRIDWRQKKIATWGNDE